MRKEQEITLNGLNIKVRQLSFAEGTKLLTLLGNIIGPALKNSPKSDYAASLIGDILCRLNHKDLTHIIETLAKSTTVERTPGQWPLLEPEVDLVGNYDLTMRWLKFSLEVNFGDFFAAGGLVLSAINTNTSAANAT